VAEPAAAGEPVRVTVRYYAGARAAAGVESEPVNAATVADLIGVLASRHGDRLRRVLDAATLLVEGQAVRDRALALRQEVTVEVLPPFAGG
jgi:molybdopterin converting factor small subunit